MVMASLPTRLAAASDTVLVLGDSLSAGYGLNAGQGWVELLQQRLHSVDNNTALVNASISGTTSSATLDRLEALLQQHRPTVCIVELGANDGLRGQPLSQLEHNLSAILSRCRQQPARTLLLGMRLPPNYGRRYTDGFAAIYQRLGEHAADASLKFFLDGVVQQDALMQADRLHPTADAQPQLMENVWQQLRPLLNTTAKPATATTRPH